jgi:hypothetical protein
MPLKMETTVSPKRRDNSPHQAAISSKTTLIHPPAEVFQLIYESWQRIKMNTSGVQKIRISVDIKEDPPPSKSTNNYKNQGNTRLNITIINTIDCLNIYLGR